MSLLILICIWLIAINKAQKYNQDSAITAVYYSYGAYCNPSEITSWNCKWCIMNPNFTVNAVIVGDDLLSYIGYNTLTSQVVLSFRGTHNIHDWIDDFEYKQVEYNLLSPYVEESYIHDGFYKAWRELSDSGLTNAIIDTFKQHQRSNILVTGHSMGAARMYYYYYTLNS